MRRGFAQMPPNQLGFEEYYTNRVSAANVKHDLRSLPHDFHLCCKQNMKMHSISAICYLDGQLENYLGLIAENINIARCTSFFRCCNGVVVVNVKTNT